MCAFHAMRALPPVGVLLGGSGRARVRTQAPPPVAILLRRAGSTGGTQTSDRVAGAALALA